MNQLLTAKNVYSCLQRFLTTIIKNKTKTISGDLFYVLSSVALLYHDNGKTQRFANLFHYQTFYYSSMELFNYMYVLH